MNKADPQQWGLTISDNQILCGGCRENLIVAPDLTKPLQTFVEGITSAVTEHLENCPRERELRRNFNG